MDTQKKSIWEKLYIGNPKKRRWFYGIMVTIFIISTFLCVKAFSQPLQSIEKTQENMIEQNTAFNYKVEVKPNTLHPEGGIIPEEGVMSGKIIKNMLVDFNSQIIAQKDIEINGTVEPTYIITAENHWEREFTTGQKSSLTNKGTTAYEMGQELKIPVPAVMDFINQVEEDTSVYADNYFLTIKPNFKGQVLYQGTEIPLDTTAELKFAVKNRQIELMGEKEFNIQTPIEVSNNIKQNFTLLGIHIPIMTSRIIFAVVWLLSLASMFLMKLHSNKKQEGNKGEWHQIDKKFKDKIIFVGQQIDIQSKMAITMESFKDLYHVAEEREQVILRVQSHGNNIIYYVLDGDFAYSYQSKLIEKTKDYSVRTEGV